MSFVFSGFICNTFHALSVFHWLVICFVFQTLVTFVNKQLMKVNLEVNDLDTQVNVVFFSLFSLVEFLVIFFFGGGICGDWHYQDKINLTS